MGLSKRNIDRAYEVLHELKNTVLPELSIDNFPQDLANSSTEEQSNPKFNQLYGFDKKIDSTWENLVIFLKDPTLDQIQKFDELKAKVGNSAMNEKYWKNELIWVMGWY